MPQEIWEYYQIVRCHCIFAYAAYKSRIPDPWATMPSVAGGFGAISCRVDHKAASRAGGMSLRRDLHMLRIRKKRRAIWPHLMANRRERRQSSAGLLGNGCITIAQRSPYEAEAEGIHLHCGDLSGGLIACVNRTVPRRVRCAALGQVVRGWAKRRNVRCAELHVSEKPDRDPCRLAKRRVGRAAEVYNGTEGMSQCLLQG